MNLEGLANGAKGFLAIKTNPPPEILTRQAEDEFWEVRLYTARNPNTPPEALDFLSDDEYSFIRCNVAMNPNTPPETLDRLADEFPWDVERNPNTPQYVKEYLDAVEFMKKAVDNHLLDCHTDSC